MTERPCPYFAVDEDDERYYCEIGPYGHEGTHVGARSQDEYEALLLAYRRRGQDPA